MWVNVDFLTKVKQQSKSHNKVVQSVIDGNSICQLFPIKENSICKFLEKQLSSWEALITLIMTMHILQIFSMQCQSYSAFQTENTYDATSESTGLQLRINLYFSYYSVAIACIKLQHSNPVVDLILNS